MVSIASGPPHEADENDHGWWPPFFFSLAVLLWMRLSNTDVSHTLREIQDSMRVALTCSSCFSSLLHPENCPNATGHNERTIGALKSAEPVCHARSQAQSSRPSIALPLWFDCI